MAERAVILDACLAITFGQLERLNLITAGSRRIAIGARAREEVVRPPARTELEAALREGKVEVESIDLDDHDEQDALARYDATPAFRGRGDAEVIALAVCRGYVVGSDDQAIRGRVKKDLGPARIAGTLDVVVWAVRDGRLTVDDASAFLRACDVGPALLKALHAEGRSLEDVV